MTLPNFLLIGAPKCGTTSLYRYLVQHPQIFMSANKEPNFFALEGHPPHYSGPGDERAGMSLESVTDLATYQALFAPSGGASALGEASTMYLYLPETAERIHHYVPQAKLIAVLRHPVERAYSHYLHLRNDGREWLEDFHAALDAEDERIAQNYAPAWHYRHVGLYSQQIQRYRQYFGPDQLKIFLYEDLRQNQAAVIQEMFDFLGLDPAFQPDTSSRHNVSNTVRRHQWLHNFLTRDNPVKSMLRAVLPKSVRQPLATRAYKQNVTKAPPFNPQLKQELLPLFKDDIEALQPLIQKDLSSWLTV